MPKSKVKPYTCVRCGYNSDQKNNMRYHLYKRQNVCPGVVDDIELTDEVKDQIMRNRVYHIPKTDEVKVVNNTINNYNMMNNFISGVDTMKKLQDYISHQNIDLIPFEKSVELKYEKTKVKLEKGIGHHEIRQEDIMEIIDQVTKVHDRKIEEFSLVFDPNVNKLMMYAEDGDWREMFVSSGLKTLTKTIQEHFWDAYECYLIRKIVGPNTNHVEKQRLRELLYEYYKFLACIDVEPHVKGKYDNMVLSNPDDDKYWSEPGLTDVHSYKVVDEYNAFYIRTKDQITNKQREDMKRDLLDLIKRNTKRNINELNQMVMDLVKVDKDFQRRVLPVAL